MQDLTNYLQAVREDRAEATLVLSQMQKGGFTQEDLYAFSVLISRIGGQYYSPGDWKKMRAITPSQQLQETAIEVLDEVADGELLAEMVMAYFGGRLEPIIVLED